MADAELMRRILKMAQMEIKSIEAIEAEDKKVVIKRTSKKPEGRVELLGQQLLPGIPNEITINQVAPKLAWKTFHILSSVSHGWQQAIQSHQVFDARVHSQSTETLVVMNHQPQNSLKAVALYSLSDGTSYDIPPIPGLSRGLPFSSQCVSLDGKLYVLGGFKESSDDAIAKVYVLDLAGQRHWEQCASMKNGRGEFGCSVINGKIFVFGGTTGFEPVCGSEMYDPESDSWSPIAPMKSFRFNHKVTAIGGELFVHDGEIYDSDFLEGSLNYDDDSTLSDHIQQASSAEVYHPLKNKWRIVRRFTKPEEMEILLMVGGKLHKLTWQGIDVYNNCAKSWKPSQSISYAVFGPSDCTIDELLAVVAVNNELLGVVHWTDHDEGAEGTCLMRSEGLGCKNKEIVWQATQCSLSLDNLESPCLCPIQL